MYRWLFDADEEFIGSYSEAVARADALADEWERRTGGLVLRLELERRGKAASELSAQIEEC